MRLGGHDASFGQTGIATDRNGPSLRWRAVPRLPRGDRGHQVAMTAVLAVLILALIFGGLGFAIHVLWIVAVVLGIVWLVLMATHSPRTRL